MEKNPIYNQAWNLMFEDPAKGRALLRPLADKGDAEALYYIGESFTFRGNDNFEAKEILDPLIASYDKGNANAAMSLARLYEGAEWASKPLNEYFNEPDFDKARSYYNEAYKRFVRDSEKGDAEAQRQLSQCLMMGLGCKTDFEESFVWLEKSFEGGCVAAAVDLYDYWRREDLDKAEKYYKWLKERNIPCAPFGASGIW